MTCDIQTCVTQQSFYICKSCHGIKCTECISSEVVENGFRPVLSDRIGIVHTELTQKPPVIKGYSDNHNIVARTVAYNILQNVSTLNIDYDSSDTREKSLDLEFQTDTTMYKHLYIEQRLSTLHEKLRKIHELNRTYVILTQSYPELCTRSIWNSFTKILLVYKTENAYNMYLKNALIEYNSMNKKRPNILPILSYYVLHTVHEYDDLSTDAITCFDGQCLSIEDQITYVKTITKRKNKNVMFIGKTKRNNIGYMIISNAIDINITPVCGSYFDKYDKSITIHKLFSYTGLMDFSRLFSSMNNIDDTTVSRPKTTHTDIYKKQFNIRRIFLNGGSYGNVPLSVIMDDTSKYKLDDATKILCTEINVVESKNITWIENCNTGTTMVLNHILHMNGLYTRRMAVLYLNLDYDATIIQFESMYQEYGIIPIIIDITLFKLFLMIYLLLQLGFQI